MTPPSPIDLLADWLVQAQRPLAFTGAGMSAESGLSTFRGGDASLWQRFDPMQLATADAWRRDAALVWGWYVWRMAKLRAAEPNAGHRALARLPAGNPMQVVTQNVDDLHERAGSRSVLHLHGRLLACRCFDCGAPQPLELPADAADAPLLRRAPPRCPACHGELRPGVVWFGEALPAAEWDAAVHAAKHCDLLLVIGTSGVVQPAASLVELARRAGARVAEINPQASALSDAADLVLRLPAAVALPAIEAAVTQR